MRIRSSLFLLAAFAALSCVSVTHAVTVQDPVLDIDPNGNPYLWVEAESSPDLPMNGLQVVTADDPIFTPTMTTADPPAEIVKGGLPVLPPDTNASGGAAMFQDTIGGLGTATWDVEFANPGLYYLFIHWSVYNRDTNTNYGNEDSFWLPPDWNLDTNADWIGFEGVDFATEEPKVGDGDQDGYIDGFPTFAQNYMSEGVVEQHNSTDEDFYDGQFHWYWISKANDMNADGGFVSFDGMAIQYEVGEEDLNTPLTFTVRMREPQGVIDGLLFTQDPELLFFQSQEWMDDTFLPTTVPLRGDFNGDGVQDADDINALTEQSALGTNPDAYDLTGDGLVNSDDVTEWIKADDIGYSWLGDSDLDGEFKSDDVILVLSENTYELDVDAVWTSGDWNGNGRFSSQDVIDSLADGGYENGPRTDVASVPEPASFALALIGLTVLGQLRRRR